MRDSDLDQGAIGFNLFNERWSSTRLEELRHGQGALALTWFKEPQPVQEVIGFDPLGSYRL